MKNDWRATQIGRWLTSGTMSPDAVRVIAYLIQEKEAKGDLEIFVSDEIDSNSTPPGEIKPGRPPGERGMKNATGTQTVQTTKDTTMPELTPLERKVYSALLNCASGSTEGNWKEVYLDNVYEDCRGERMISITGALGSLQKKGLYRQMDDDFGEVKTLLSSE